MREWLSYFFIALGLMTILSAVCGCQNTDIAIPYNAPIMLSGDETLHNPYAREHGQWVKKQGTVTRHQGAVVILLPATQPTTQP